jgi:phospholipase C
MVMPSALAKIKHVVVVMMENRSFDNFLGSLYAEQGNTPPRNLPPRDPPTFDGLRPFAGPDPFWNPSNADFFTDDAVPTRLLVSSPTSGTTPFRVPNPDPNEGFAEITFQLFGTINPADNEAPKMLGFLVDYGRAKGSSPDLAGQIMQCYSPAQLPVLSQLARNFAVSDAWFASVPAQTWPNRGFVHTGTSRGEVTNGNVVAYNTETIFEVLNNIGASWGIYRNTILPSLTGLQYPRLLEFPTRFHTFAVFKTAAHQGTLPQYSFIEPSFVFQPDDQHPPHDVSLGERFLQDVWTAVSTGPHWNETLLVITYDEHGGCYDHVPPPWGATIPDAASDPGALGFRFNRFGVRVPVVVISPYIEAGTVFRSATATPFDHTSILATIRDWLGIPEEKMLPSKRIKAAPTLEFLLTLDQPRAVPPPIPAAHPQFALFGATDQLLAPLNDLQLSMIVAVEANRLKRGLTAQEVQLLRQSVPNVSHMAAFFHGAGLLSGIAVPAG